MNKISNRTLALVAGLSAGMMSGTTIMWSLRERHDDSAILIAAICFAILPIDLLRRSPKINEWYREHFTVPQQRFIRASGIPYLARIHKFVEGAYYTSADPVVILVRSYITAWFAGILIGFMAR